VAALVCMDAVSEVLKAVKSGARVLLERGVPPWSFRSPNSCKPAPNINQFSGHVILYHLMIEGQAHGRLC